MPSPSRETMSFGFRRPTPVVLALIITLVVAYVATNLAVRFTSWGPGAMAALVLLPGEVLGGHQVWGLLTSCLLHDLQNPQHLVFNCLGLFFFGPPLEERWGSGRFGLFTLVTALGGSVLVVLTALVGLGAAPVYGASAISMGTLVAWGLTFPDQQMLLFFVLPVRGLHIVYISLALEVLNAISLSPVSAAAHFGGMGAAAAFIAIQRGSLRRWWLQRKLGRLQAQADAFGGVRPAARRPGAPGLRVIQGGGGDPPKDKRFLN